MRRHPYYKPNAHHCQCEAEQTKSFVSESFRSVLCALYCFFVFCRVLRDNWYLRNIQEDAFEGATGPTDL